MVKNFTDKVITKKDFATLREGLREGNQKVVMCHGVYDLLHYGHLKHLEEAKRQGDILVVSVTSAAYVNKGPDRPYYSDRQRTEFLASLSIVDYVILSKESTAKGNITVIQPDIFVKGQEFENGDDGITGNVSGEITQVEKYGGKVYYTQGEVHSSSKLLNNYFDALPENVMEAARQIKVAYGENIMDSISNWVEKFSALKVLVIGDVILDEYVFCRAQGLTSKDTVISTRYENEERYLGGSLAIARHISNFTSNVTVLSMMGMEPGLFESVAEEVDDELCLEIIRDSHFVTPVKRRFLKRHPQRDEYDKLFSINTLLDTRENVAVNYEPLYKRLRELIPLFDLVVVSDYGHGLIDSNAMAIIEEGSRFLSLNCQTNSSNYGTNLITKYNRADTFALDEKELRLAFGQATEELKVLLIRLLQKLHGTVGWLTVGADGAVSADLAERLYHIPALTLQVKDTVGAGDAFFALSSLCAAEKLPMDIATLISNAAGAIKTHMLGNSGQVEKKTLLKFVNTVLNI